MRYLLHLLIIAIPLIMGADVVGQYGPQSPMPAAPGTPLTSKTRPWDGPYYRKYAGLKLGKFSNMVDQKTWGQAFCGKECSIAGCKNPFRFKECVLNCPFESWAANIDNCVKKNFDFYKKVPQTLVDPNTNQPVLNQSGAPMYPQDAVLCRFTVDQLSKATWPECAQNIINYLDKYEEVNGNLGFIEAEVETFQNEQTQFGKALTALYGLISGIESTTQKIHDRRLKAKMACKKLEKALAGNDSMSTALREELIRKCQPADKPNLPTFNLNEVQTASNFLTQYNAIN